MTISRQTLSAVIVTFKSERVIHDCIKSIPNEIKIIVIDNSNDTKFQRWLQTVQITLVLNNIQKN